MHLYIEFYKKNEHIYLLPGKKSEFHRECQINRYCFNKVFANLNIELPSSMIKSIYEKWKVIQLRTINSKVLILGCGSGPLIYGSSEVGFKEKHAHQNEITMSPELSFNPTIVGFFEGNFKFEDNYFAEVEFEGFFARELNAIIEHLTDAKRILIEGGKISFSVNAAKKTYVKEQIDLIIEHYKTVPDFDILRSDFPLINVHAPTVSTPKPSM